MNLNNSLNKRKLSFKKANAFFALMTLPMLYTTAQELVKSSPAGSGIYEAVVNPADQHIYVTGAGTRTSPGGALYKINPTSLAIVDSIKMADHPPYGIGLNSKTQLAYTTNTRTNTVSVVDLKSGKVINHITNGKEKSHTREVLVDEVNNLVYVSDVGDPSAIWVIDGKTNTFAHLIENVGKTTTGMTFLKGTDLIYVTIMGDNTVGVLNTKTKTMERTFPSGGEAPVNIASDGTHLFVTNQKSGDLTVLDASGKLIKRIETGAGAIGVSYDAVKNRIYVANRQTGTTSVIDAKSLTLLKNIETGSHPNHVKVDTKTGAAYVINKTKRMTAEAGATPAVDTNGDTISKIN